MNVEQVRARGIGDIRDVHRPLGKLPHQPGIHRSEPQLSRLRPLPGSLHVPEDPLHLAGTEIRIQAQTGPCRHPLLEAVPLQFRAALRRAPVLPDDRVVDRLAGFRVPDHRGLPLVGDSDSRHRPPVRSRQRLLHGGPLRVPDLLRFVFHPTRLRVMLRKLPLHGLHRAPGLIEQDRSRTGGSLVEREDKLHSAPNHPRQPHFTSVNPAPPGSLTRITTLDFRPSSGENPTRIRRFVQHQPSACLHRTKTS